MSIVGSIVNDRVVNQVLDEIYFLKKKNMNNQITIEILNELQEKVENMLGDE